MRLLAGSLSSINFATSPTPALQRLSLESGVLSLRLVSSRGDPQGSLLFCLSIHPLLMSLSSDLFVGFLDDITLGGSQDSVSDDVRAIMEGGLDLGLHLNISKCELISRTVISLDDATLSSFQRLDFGQSTLLGAPLTTGVAMDSSFSSRLADLKRAALRLKPLASHDALTLLRFSLSAPRLMHSLRASPSFGNPLLLEFDSALRDCLCSVVNADLSDTQWIQASLPVRLGGLGIRLVSHLAPSAFLASALSTRQLQDAILLHCTVSPDVSVDRAVSF